MKSTRRRQYTPAEKAQWRADQQKAHVERAEGMVAALLARFEDGSIAEPIQRSVIMRHSDDPLSARPMLNWSFLNQMWCMMHGTSDARGSNQWKEVGRHPSKGSEAIQILIPTFKTWWEAATEAEIANPDINTTAAGKVKRQFLSGFKTGPVFRYEDTTAFPGQPEHLQQWDYAPPSLPPLSEFAASIGVDVSYVPMTSGDQGFGSYQMGGDAIRLHTEDTKTFWHELAHALHDRVLKARGIKMESVPLAMLEVVAETSATVIASLYGEDWSGNCFEYLQSYLADVDAKGVLTTIGKVVRDIEQIVSILLAAGKSTESGVAAMQTTLTTQETSPTASA